MRSLWLALPGLLSCSIFVSRINPCFDKENDPEVFCFEKKQDSIVMAGKVREMKIGDIDGDGLLDVVAFVEEPGKSVIHVLFQNSDGTFTDKAIEELNSAVSFDVGDIEQAQSNVKDEIVVVHSGDISVIREEGGLLLSATASFLELGVDKEFEGNPRVVVFGKFNETIATLEISVAFLDELAFIARIQNFSFDGVAITPTGFSTENDNSDLANIGALLDFKVHNLDNDTDDEFVLITNPRDTTALEAILFSNNAGAEPPSIIPLGSVGTPTLIVNLDESPELEFVFGDTINVSSPIARILFTDIASSPPNPPNGLVPFVSLLDDFRVATIGELNDDGRLELLIVNAKNQLEIIRQDETGAFTSSGLVINLSTVQEGDSRESIIALDINNDGIDDILAPDAANQIEVFVSVP